MARDRGTARAEMSGPVAKPASCLGTLGQPTLAFSPWHDPMHIGAPDGTSARALTQSRDATRRERSRSSAVRDVPIETSVRRLPLSRTRRDTCVVPGSLPRHASRTSMRLG
jgi:hypothetical protein